MRQGYCKIPTTISPQTVNCCLTPKYISVSSSVKSASILSNNFIQFSLLLSVRLMEIIAIYMKRIVSYRLFIITYRLFIKVYMKRCITYRLFIKVYMKRCITYRLFIKIYMKRCITYRIRIFSSIIQSISSKLSIRLRLVHFHFYNNYISNQNITTVLLINY